MRVEKQTGVTGRNVAKVHAGQRPDDRGRERMCAMLRHRSYGYFSALILALVMALAIAGPIDAQIAGPAEVVEITATVVDVLEVEFPAEVAFGELPSVWDPEASSPPAFDISVLIQPAAIIVSSSRQYVILQGGDDQSTGPVFSEDFVLGFFDENFAPYDYPAEFALGTALTIGPYEAIYQRTHQWTFVLGLFESQMPLPTGTIHYVLTLSVAQL